MRERIGQIAATVLVFLGAFLAEAGPTEAAEITLTLLEDVYGVTSRQPVAAAFPAARATPATLEIQIAGSKSRQVYPEIRVNGRLVCRPGFCARRIGFVANDQNVLAIEFKRNVSAPVAVKVTQQLQAEAAAVVEPYGGFLSVTEPSPLQGVSLEIPCGALAHSTVVALALPSASPGVPGGTEATTRLVRVQPSGMQLGHPAILRLPLLNPADTRPSMGWSFVEDTQQWVPLGLHGLRGGTVAAEIDHFSLALGVTSSQHTVSTGHLTVLAQPSLFNEAGEEHDLRCDTLGPRGVTYLVANAGGIDPHGEFLLEIDRPENAAWREQLRELAHRHLTASPNTTVLLWLNANEAEGQINADDILVPEAARQALAQEVGELMRTLFDGAGSDLPKDRIGLFFDIEPVWAQPPTCDYPAKTRILEYADLLVKTRTALNYRTYGSSKIAVYPMKLGHGGEWFWSRSDFLSIAASADLFLYGAYDYHDSVADVREYRARVMADVTILGSLGLAPKTIVLASTQHPDPTKAHHDPERFVEGIAGARYSPFAPLLKGIGVFQLWGEDTEGRDPHDAEWCALNAALPLQAPLTYDDCAAVEPEVPTGMSHWWPFDGNADDIAGLRDGWNYGATAARGHTGATSTALHFDGGDYIDMHGVLAPVTGFSVSFWMKLAVHRTTSGYMRENQVMGNAGGNRGFRFHQQDDRFVFQCQGRSGNGSGGTILLTPSDVDQWTHIVGVYTGRQAYLYRDGFLKEVGLDRATMDPAILAFEVGRDPNLQTSYWRGDLDEIRIYPRALTALEVRQLTHARSVCQE